MESLSFWVDALPDMSLGKNARRRGQFWQQQRDTATEIDRALAMLIPLTRGLKGTCGPVHLTVTVYYKDRRRRDVPNIVSALSPWIDALVALGLLADDSIRYLPRLTVEGKLKCDKEGMEWTITLITGS